MTSSTERPPVIKDALFARVREYDSAAKELVVKGAVDTWSIRTFVMPLAKQTTVIRERGLLKALQLNCDILIPPGHREVKDIHVAVQ